jgi:MHS family proline/betaine transporter-like MFS transporter
LRSRKLRPTLASGNGPEKRAAGYGAFWGLGEKAMHSPVETQTRRAVSAAVIGNVLEWYDFSVYAFVAVIIAKNFFPAGNDAAALLATFAAFGIGFLARPLGGVLIGWIGDKYGRKTSLLITIFLMAVGTVMIGLIPTYATIGLLAPMILVVARLLQGFSAGGEWGGSTAFIVEWAPANKRGFYGSFQQMSVVLGLLLGSATGAVLNTIMTPEQMDAWGWRLPFLLGGILGPVGLWMRSTIDETPAYSAARHADIPTVPEKSADGTLDVAKLARSLFFIGLLGILLSLLWWATFYFVVAKASFNDSINCLIMSTSGCTQIKSAPGLQGALSYEPALLGVAALLAVGGFLLLNSIKRQGDGDPLVLATQAFGFTILWTVSFYIFLSYMPTFTQRYAGLSRAAALWSNTAGLLLLMIAIPYFGHLSDKYGRKPFLLACCLAFIVLPYPAFSIMVSGASVTTILLIQLLIGLTIALFSGAGPAAISEIFPTRTRSSYMSTGYALAVAIFGGFAPFIATLLIEKTGSPISPVYYVIFAAIVSAAVVAALRETAHRPLG